MYIKAKQLKNKKGFTLVELIVVIAVLALLAVGAVIFFMGIMANARRSTFRRDTAMLVDAANHFNHNASTPITDTADFNVVQMGDLFSVTFDIDTDPWIIHIGITFPTEDRYNTIINEGFIIYDTTIGRWRVDDNALQSFF
jgi:type IV pilus assembly protein PilA